MRHLYVIGLCLSFSLGDVYIHNSAFFIQKPLASWADLRDSNLTKQQYDYSCGSASLSTILTYYYKQNVSEKDILDFLLIAKGIDVSQKKELENNKALRDSVNFSFADLADFAQAKGFKAIGVALDISSLSQLKTPVIIYVNIRDMEHFTVYKGMDSHFVYLADPSFGNMKVSIAKFIEMFYQRQDLTHPGKILAILPEQEGMPTNLEFLNIAPTTLTYEAIKHKVR